MFVVTAPVTCAACCIAQAILLIAELGSFTAAAMATATVLIATIARALRMAARPPPMACCHTDPPRQASSDTMRLRCPAPAEIMLQLFCLVILLLAAFDVLAAVGTATCTPQQPGDCIPWGREGPWPWFYSSKSLYVATGLALVAACAVGVLAPLLSRRRWLRLVSPLVVLLLVLMRLAGEA